MKDSLGDIIDFDDAAKRISGRRAARQEAAEDRADQENANITETAATIIVNGIAACLSEENPLNTEPTLEALAKLAEPFGTDRAAEWIWCAWQGDGLGIEDNLGRFIRVFSKRLRRQMSMDERQAQDAENYRKQGIVCLSHAEDFGFRFREMIVDHVDEEAFFPDQYDYRSDDTLTFEQRRNLSDQTPGSRFAAALLEAFRVPCPGYAGSLFDYLMTLPIATIPSRIGPSFRAALAKVYRDFGLTWPSVAAEDFVAEVVRFFLYRLSFAAIYDAEVPRTKGTTDQ
jgi:hypothetical protein